MRKNGYGGKVLSFWSWNGKIDFEEISEQLTDFADGHFDGVIVHARAGLETAYLSEKWFEAFGFAVSEAERLGLDVYIYDEDGWPSGFAGGIVNGLGEEYWLKGLKYGKPSEADKNRLVAAFKKSQDGSMNLIDLNDADIADLVFWYKTDSYYVDLMSEKTVRAFIDCTHEEYRKRFSAYFGKVIKGVFTDEPQLDAMLPWSSELPEKFTNRCGYELLPSLWRFTDKGEEGKKFRNDYFSSVSDAFFNAFTKQIREWCEQNNLLFTGHFPCEDGLCGQIATTGGVMKHYSAMQMPGIDHLGNMQHSPVLMKQVSSVAQQLGNGEVLCEVFGCAGWDVTLSNLAWIWGRQSALGVTTACCHLSAFTMEGIRKRDYPAFFSYQNLWWSDFIYLKHWMRNLNELMSEGTRETNAALLSPFHSVKCEFNGTMDSFRLRSCSSQFRQTLQNLIDMQIDAEIVDEEILEKYGCVENGMLKIGKRSYKYFIIPDCDSIKRFTFEKIRELSNFGVRVIFINSRPSMIDLIPSEEIKDITAAECCNRVELLERMLKTYKIEQPVKVLNPDDMSLMHNITLHTVSTENGKRIHICCGDDFTSKDVILSVEGKCSFAFVDILSGKRSGISSAFSGTESFAKLKLRSMENAVIEIKEYEPSFGDTKLVLSRNIVPQSISMCDLNCYTADKAYYVIDGEASELMPVINMAKILYGRAKPSLTAEVCYPFYIDSVSDISDVRAAVEDRNIDAVSVNGTDITAERGDWWLDKSIHEYEITKYLVPGRNVISLKYTIEKNKTDINVDEVFETERNRFFYPKEPESIYIRGNFDVAANVYFENHFSFYRIQSDEFRLVKPTVKHYGELTRQGLWFYRGNFNYEFRYIKPETAARCVLRIEEPFCSALRWNIGDKGGEIFTLPFEQDITDALKTGENIISLCAVGSNRNLLGPHHHIKGKTNFVGVNTFVGKYGFEDFANPEITGGDTWDDTYNFVPFDCGKIFIDEYAVSEEK